MCLFSLRNRKHRYFSLVQETITLEIQHLQLLTASAYSLLSLATKCELFVFVASRLVNCCQMALVRIIIRLLLLLPNANWFVIFFLEFCSAQFLSIANWTSSLMQPTPLRLGWNQMGIVVFIMLIPKSVSKLGSFGDKRIFKFHSVWNWAEVWFIILPLTFFSATHEPQTWSTGFHPSFLG